MPLRPAGQELSEHRARSAETSPRSQVFAGRRRNVRANPQTISNLGRRVKTAIRHANEHLGDPGIKPISERVPPQSLRRTYASLWAGLRDDPVYTPSSSITPTQLSRCAFTLGPASTGSA